MAAGISTIGLQTKKLSGAQRKGLARERKMRKGTWTEKKPPRKNPSSLDKGTVVISGGVTPLRLEHIILGKTTTKNPRNTSADWIV